MTLSDLAALATVVSSVAVLVSLLYLGLQTRQNTKHTRAMIQQARNRQIVESEMLYVSNPIVRDLAVRGDAADPSLTSDQVRAYIHFTSAQMMMFEDMFYQYRAGLIDEERHKSTVAALKNTKACRPGFRVAWPRCKQGLGVEFQALVDETIRTTEPRLSPRDMGLIWREATAAELQQAGGHSP